jgi:hypothetical protein
MLDVVRRAASRMLVAAAAVLAGLVPQRDQAPQVDRDVVGLPRRRGSPPGRVQGVGGGAEQAQGHDARTKAEDQPPHAAFGTGERGG